MSLKSVFLLIGSIAFGLMACKNWNYEIRLQTLSVPVFFGGLAFVEMGWLYLNVMGIKECKKFEETTVDKTQTMTTAMLCLFFAGMVMFQFLFLIRQCMNLGTAMAG